MLHPTFGEDKRTKDDFHKPKLNKNNQGFHENTKQWLFKIPKRLKNKSQTIREVINNGPEKVNYKRDLARGTQKIIGQDKWKWK